MRPVLDRLGRQIVHMGGHGAGQIAKACNQLALLVNAEGVAEALTLGASLRPRSAARSGRRCSAGLPPAVCSKCSVERMVERQFAPGMPTRLYDKDLNIVLDLAADVRQPLPAAIVVRKHMNELVERGASNEDLAALIQVIEPA